MNNNNINHNIISTHFYEKPKKSVLKGMFLKLHVSTHFYDGLCIKFQQKRETYAQTYISAENQGVLYSNLCALCSISRGYECRN